MWKRKKKPESLVFLPPDSILQSPWQTRRNFEPDAMRRLVDSIARYGILSPLTVRKRGEEYELIFGERRLRAAKFLDLPAVPCRVAEVSPKSGAEIALIENLMREDLNIFEEAGAIDRLLKTFHYTQTELAEKLGQSQSTIANKLRILRLGAEERVMICENELSYRHARALIRVQDPSMRLFALRYIIAKNYNVRQTEAFLDALLEHPDEFMVTLAPTRRLKPVRRLVVRDVRLFVNSVDHAIDSIRQAGFSIEAEKQEEDRYISYVIRVPKYAKA